MLSVRSSSGQMQHQVSLLAPADLEVVRASGGVTTSDIGAVGAPGSSTATSIQIRRGDTLFALARRHAVSGVSVYQWMIGVMRANPQAFINNNVNLIKAGATLNVPGEQQLAALSDRQAREIFQKHAAAFAQYRQRTAREVSRIEPAAAQTADSGRVTTSEAESVPAPVPQPQDRLVLQSAQASSSTGSSTLTDPSATVASTAADSSGGNVGGQAASSNGEQSASSSASGQATRTAVNRSTAPVSNDDQLALERNTEQARERVNQLEANVKNLNQALQQQGAAAHDAVVLGAKTVEDTVEQLKQIVDGNTAGPDTAVTDSVTNSQASDTNDNNGTARNDAAVASNAGASVGAGGLGETSSVAATRVASNGGSAASSDGSGSDSSSPSSWFMDNLLIIISGALALVVLIVAWLLRRVGAERDDESDAVITEEMVRERLQSINLDLDDPSETGKSDKRS
ncbi:MAG: hypothetical protein H5U29_11095 [Pusillimonas sp.]|nr:hypothetical protein [Pusillimonas sp.]